MVFGFGRRARPAWLRGLHVLPPMGVTCVQATGEGLSMRDAAGTAVTSPWDNIEEIIARTAYHGRGRGVGLWVRLRDREQIFELDDRTEGWDDLLDRMPVYLPGSVPINEWYNDVRGALFGRLELSIYQHGK